MPVELTAPPVETRGLTVYLTPDASPQVIADRVRLIQRTGFNFLVLKVFRRGHCLMPTEAWAEAAGKRFVAPKAGDVTAHLVHAAGELGLPVYAGLELLEHIGAPGESIALRAIRPEWYLPANWPAAVRWRARLAREMGEKAESRQIHFMSPLEAGARRFVGELLVELVSKYPFSGIFIDHATIPCFGESGDLDHRSGAKIVSDLTRRQREEDDENEDAATGDPRNLASLNSAMSSEVLGLLAYARARLRRCRGQILGAMEVREGGACDGKAAVGDQATEAPWRDALNSVAEMLSPRFEVHGAQRIEGLAAQMELFGNEAPLLPLLRLPSPELDILPFEQIRRSSALGFVIDAGLPLNDQHWNFFGRLFEDAAVASHTDPPAAIRAIGEHTISLLGKDHDLSALLTDMFRILGSPKDATQDERTRLSVIRNLSGLAEMARTNQLDLPPDPARWQIARNLGLLVRLLAMVSAQRDAQRAEVFYT